MSLRSQSLEMPVGSPWYLNAIASCLLTSGCDCGSHQVNLTSCSINDSHDAVLPLTQGKRFNPIQGNMLPLRLRYGYRIQPPIFLALVEFQNLALMANSHISLDLFDKILDFISSFHQSDGSLHTLVSTKSMALAQHTLHLACMDHTPICSPK